MYINCFVIYLDFPSNNHIAKKQQQTKKQRNKDGVSLGAFNVF